MNDNPFTCIIFRTKSFSAAEETQKLNKLVSYIENEKITKKQKLNEYDLAEKIELSSDGEFEELTFLNINDLFKNNIIAKFNVSRTEILFCSEKETKQKRVLYP